MIVLNRAADAASSEGGDLAGGGPGGRSAALSARLRAGDMVGALAAWGGFARLVLDGTEVRVQLAVVAVAWASTLVALQLMGLYRTRICASAGTQRARILLATSLGGATFVGAWDLTGSMPSQAVAAALLAAGACALLLAGNRWYFERWLQVQRATGRFLRPVVVVGALEDAERLCVMLESEPALGYEVRAVVGPWAESGSWPEGVIAKDDLHSVSELAAMTGCNGVLVARSHLSSDDVSTVIHQGLGSGLHVQMWAGLKGLGMRRLRPTPVSGEPFFYVEPLSQSNWRLAIKRTIDVVGAGSALLASSPLLLTAALLVKLEDRGPVLFRQERVGKDGVVFEVLKLRSMAIDASSRLDEVAALNERTGPLFKAARDPRVTRVGRLIRAASIDELPQLINVLRGEMSLVGPRPALPRESAEFDADLRRRESVRPGITGLWQLEARENPSFDAYRRLDLHYVDNWSLGLDVALLVSTLPLVAGQALRTATKLRRRLMPARRSVASSRGDAVAAVVELSTLAAQ